MKSGALLKDSRLSPMEGGLGPFLELVLLTLMQKFVSSALYSSQNIFLF